MVVEKSNLTLQDATGSIILQIERPFLKLNWIPRVKANAVMHPTQEDRHQRKHRPIDRRIDLHELSLTPFDQAIPGI